MKKLIIYLFLIVFILFIGISFLFQIKYEKYINNQKKELNILKDRKRINYKPAFFYYIQSTVFKKKEINKNSLGLIWKDLELSSYKNIYSIDEYILECYYTEGEKEYFIKAEKSNPSE